MLDTAHILAQSADPRSGFQDIFLFFTLALAVIAVVSRKLAVIGICLVAWIVGTTIAFSERSTLEAISRGVGNLIEWFAGRF